LRHVFDDYGLAQRKALIRYYFKEEPKTIDEFSRLWNELLFALQFDGKMKIEERKKG